MKQKLLTLLLMAFLPLAMMAYDVEIDGIYYNVVKKAKIATVTQGDNPYTGDVVIPPTIVFEGVECTVTSIGDNAFYSCTGLTSISIPNSVTSIGNRAFYNCSDLTSVTIPEGVTSIGSGAFSGCSSLASVTIPSSVTSIGSEAFYSCSSLTSVYISDLVSWCNMTCRSPFFRDNGFSFNRHFYLNGEEIKGNLTIPEGVTSICASAFANCCSLTSVTIPEGVTSIGGEAFKGCSSLTSVTIPEGVTDIANAFKDCSSLTSVTIPSSVTGLEKDAFKGCSSLTSVTINSNAVMSTNYKKYNEVIWDAYNLASVFGYQLAELIIGEGVTSIGYMAFYEGSGLTSVTIPSSVTSIGDGAFAFCTGLTSVTIPSSVTSIGESAFARCSSLTSVTIPEGVTSIGDGAFSNCSSLTSVTIPEGVTSIGHRAFSDCSGLTSVTIPEGVTSIGNNTFWNCSSLTSVTIPSSVTSIGDRAFWNCSSLTSVTIPSSVTSIGDQAFLNCENLEVVTCNATTVPSTNTNAFDGSYTEYATLIVPDEALSDYQTTAPWSNFGTILGSSQATVVTANSYTREYGDPNPTPFGYTAGITLDGEPSITCSATETSAPGVYPIVITRGTETNAGLIYVNGTLTITKAPLTITAKSYTINEGDAMPTFEVEYDGFKNDETADDLTPQPTISCTATDTNTEGTYDITVSGAASDNYDISYVAGKLTVVPTDAHITITSAGMGTYCSPYDLDFTSVTDLKAYTITGYDKASSRVYAMRVYDVPAGTGLYLVGNPGDYDVPISTSNSYYINMLVGTLEQTWIDTTDGDLTNLRLTGTNPSNASFKILSEGRNFSANRAYLQIPTYILGNTANAATAFGIVLDDDTNGIEDIMLNSDDTDSEWYTLDGRKLNGKPTARGIYVVKGRKVVIK